MRRRMTRLHASIGTAAALAGALLTGALFLPQSSVGQEAEIEIEKVEKEQPKGEAVTVRRVPGVGQADRAMALKATTLLDMDVNTRRGEDMGEIEDLVLDLNTGKSGLPLSPSAGSSTSATSTLPFPGTP